MNSTIKLLEGLRIMTDPEPTDWNQGYNAALDHAIERLRTVDASRPKTVSGLSPELLAMIADVPAATDEIVGQLATRAKAGGRAIFDDDDILSLIARVVAERKGGSWQDISTAPKDGTKIDVWAINHLTYNKPGLRIVNVYWGRVSDWMGTERDDWIGAASDDIEPTHWQPLPTPPALSALEER